MDLRDIPPYAEALAREQASRNAAFLDITETVAGFELRQMTLRDYLVLQVMRHPLLGGGTPSPEDLVAFLWLLSPAYRPAFTLGSFVNRRLFLRRCAGFLPSLRHGMTPERLVIAARIVEACRAYVAETMQDNGPTVRGRGFTPTYWSDGADICAALGREYGWTDTHTLGMPMKRILQYLNEIRSAHGSKTPLCNPSDRVLNEWMMANHRN